MYEKKIMLERFQNLSWKNGFILSSSLMLIIMLSVSFDYGITGDETIMNRYGKEVLSFYKSFGSDTTAIIEGAFKVGNWERYYGGSFDLLAAILNKVSFFEEYNTRHLLNAFYGFIAMLFTGLLVKEIAGWQTALLAIWLLFLSPRFFGHSMNNPKDLPFATAYIFSIYVFLRLLKKLPKPSVSNIIFAALGISFALSIRIGGLLLIAYLGVFMGLQLFLQLKKNKFKLNNITPDIIKYGVYFTICSLLGYFVGIVLWPFGIVSPIDHPIETMKEMANFDVVSITQIFEGIKVKSTNMPWYYLPKYILITTPIITLTGVIFGLVLSIPMIKKYGVLNMFILLFSFIFPLAYIIYKKSPVYGGWRHVLFITPSLISFSSIGWKVLSDKFHKKYAKVTILLFMLFLATLPVHWMIRNHPHQVTYFNTVFGGVKKAYGNYELDYYLNSLKAASNWLINNELKNNNKPIIIASNAPPQIKEYFKEHKNVKIIYVRYYERSQKEWDYAILANVYIDVFQLKRKIFPPKGTIHQETADKKPLSIVVKRENKADFRGFQAMKQNNFPEAEKQFRNALAYDKNNEQAWFGLANASINQRKIDQAYKALDQSLKLYPTYLSALNSLGMLYMRQNKFNEAILTYSKMLEINAGNAGAYYYRGLAYANTNHPNEAIQDLSMAAAVNEGLKKNAYNEIAKIYRKTGNQEMASKYLEEANK